MQLEQSEEDKKKMVEVKELWEKQGGKGERKSEGRKSKNGIVKK